MLIGSVTRCFGFVAICWLGSLCVAGSGSAAERLWGFKGTVSNYHVPNINFTDLADVPVGSTVRGQILFDDSAPDTDASPNRGVYSGLTLAIAFEGVNDLHIGIGGDVSIEIYDDADMYWEQPIGGGNFLDAIVVRAGENSPLWFPTLELLGYVEPLSLREEDNPAPTVLSSDALPAPLPALPDFTTTALLELFGYVPSQQIVETEITITEFGNVGSADLPLLPDAKTTLPNGTVIWTFSTLGVSVCVSGCWIDPPAADTFTYSMTNSALFTDIVDFPTGFGTALEVSVGAMSFGPFGPGDSLVFPGGGVAEFEVSGISPAADLTSAAGFPLNLAFDSAGAEFTMAATPVIPVPLLGWPGLFLLGGLVTLAGVQTLRRFI